jgi:phosphoglycolate phosphatase
MTPQTLIFDLDGTLIDSRRDLATGVNLMRRHYGLPPLGVDTVTGFVGDGIRKLVARSLQDAPDAVDLDDAVRRNAECYRQHLHDETALYPGVAAGLPRLAQAGHRLALLSNKPEAACRALLRHFAVDGLFACILGGDSGPALKPAPDAIFVILRAAGGAPGDTWMIGDNHTDVAVAHRAGIHSLFAAYGFGALGAEQPDMTVSSFDEITGFFST